MATDRTTSTRGFRGHIAAALLVAAAIHVQPAETRVISQLRLGSDQASATASGYRWPVRPFDVQHPIRGYFGDPRIGMTPNGVHHSFHFGVDVSAPNGTAVYATMDGVVVRWPHRPETVGIRSADGRTEFQYWHIAPAVAPGTAVHAYRSVLGHVEAPWGHVHFSELRDGAYVNPLRPGAMRPFVDTGAPVVKSVRAERTGAHVSSTHLSGTLDLVTEAVDETPLPVPAPWTGRPVTPALLRWRLIRLDNQPVMRWRTAVDFRERIPHDSAFTTIYARWTRQNVARRNGRYRFYLARAWDSTTIPDGAYKLEIAAADSRGNAHVEQVRIRIVND